jgi:hypothetical protein
MSVSLPATMATSTGFPATKPALNPLLVPGLEVPDPPAVIAVLLVVRKALQIVTRKARALTAMVQFPAGTAQGNLARAPEGLSFGLDAPGTAHSLPVITIAAK